MRGVRWLGARPTLVPFLQRAEVAVVAGGVTLYEANALGLATVSVAVAPAQRRTIAGVAAAGATIDSGLLLSSSPRTRLIQAQRIASLVADVVGRPGLGRSLGRSGRQLVDGRGLHRVVKALHGLVAGRSAA
jgi:spore coat polysaccharide biosynthesis predicted glycosyltransferase SpsG